MTQRTELSEIGEFGLIERIKKQFVTANPDSLLGIGDDAAVIDKGEEVMLLATDMMVEGVHFDLSYMPLKHLGFKAVAINVSDIAAMNGIPRQIVISLALSNRFSVEAIEELYAGIRQACQIYKVDLVGGDTCSSRSGLIINISVLGVAQKTNVVYRTGAKANDLICVTGDLGGAFMGLQVLQREKEVFMADPEMQPQLEGKEYIVERQLKPEARLDMVEKFKILNLLPTSMIDVSDGLASEIMHLCKNSEVGADIYEEKLPIDNLTFETAREFNLDPLTCMLNGGEDYELLFTIRQQDFEKIKNDLDISVIGHIKDKSEGVNLISKGGNLVPIKAQGWVHF